MKTTDLAFLLGISAQELTWQQQQTEQDIGLRLAVAALNASLKPKGNSQWPWVRLAVAAQAAGLPPVQKLPPPDDPPWTPKTDLWKQSLLARLRGELRGPPRKKRRS
jgi:hypothetical protein